MLIFVCINASCLFAKGVLQVSHRRLHQHQNHVYYSVPTAEKMIHHVHLRVEVPEISNRSLRSGYMCMKHLRSQAKACENVCHTAGPVA